MRKLLLLLLILLSGSAIAHGAGETHAVVQIPSHGASATVIETGPGYSWILGCAHAYEPSKDPRTGQVRNMMDKPMVFDIPTSHPGQSKSVGSVLWKVDFKSDLSLVLLNEGPLDFVCPVAPVNWHDWNDHILSCGFDEMQKPPHKMPTHILVEEGFRYCTRERPVPGRSGGGLIDTDKGFLIGVCQGFELPPSRQRGLYINTKTIHAFLQGAIQAGPRQRNSPRSQQHLQPIMQPQRPWCPPGGS